MPDFYQLSPADQSLRLRELGRRALAAWKLDSAGLELIKFRENAVFKVTADTGSRYALRIHRAGYHSDAELRSELEWMRALGASGFDVPVLVPAPGGALFLRVQHEGVAEPRQVDLFEWIAGEQLGNVEQEMAGGSVQDEAALERTFCTVGRLAARLHNHACSWKLPLGFTRHAWDDAGLVGEQPFWGRFWELAALKPAERRLMLAARDRLRTDLAALSRTADCYGLIHADFAPENLLVDGDRIRLLDFDDAGFGWHLFEIATSLYFQSGQPHFERIRDAIIEGYRAERPLAETEVAKLPMFLAARGFTYLGWVHTRHETETARELTPQLIALAAEAARGYLAHD